MQNLILSVDTTSEYGSLALVSGSRIIEEVALASSDGFSHVLFDKIHALLNRHDFVLRDVACFAAASGPGTFTGVRTGLTAVMGLAEACGVPVVAVSNLQAMAWFGTGGLRAPVIDARRGEIYGGLYDAELCPVQDEVVAKLNDWFSALPAAAEVITNGFPVPDGSQSITHAPQQLARAVASIAVERYAQGLARDPSEIDANYVRRTDAAMMWRDSK